LDTAKAEKTRRSAVSSTVFSSFDSNGGFSTNAWCVTGNNFDNCSPLTVPALDATIKQHQDLLAYDKTSGTLTTNDCIDDVAETGATALLSLHTILG
jgi:hypothetical protein